MHGEEHFFKAPRYLLRKHNILKLLAEHPEIKTFLDIGCGAGELACTLVERGLTGVAIDFSDSAIKHGEKIRSERHITSDQLSFRVGGLEQVEKQKFDLVICCEVLEHIEDDAAMLRNLLKHTNEYALISVPAKQKLFDESDRAVGHFRRYEREQLQQLLKSQRLDILNFVNYGYPFTNMVRIVRKTSFKNKLKKNLDDSMEDKSKESGINPVKLPSRLQKLDIEPFMKTVFYTTLPFNNLDLSEGYLALCRQPVE